MALPEWGARHATSDGCAVTDVRRRYLAADVPVADRRAWRSRRPRRCEVAGGAVILVATGRRFAFRVAVDEVLVRAAAHELHDQAGLLERDAGFVGQCPDVALSVLAESEHERVAR